MNSPNGNTQPQYGRTTRWHAIMVPALGACFPIVGVSNDAPANMPSPKPAPQMNMEMKLTVPHTVRAGDTIVATLGFTLLSPIQFPERGEHGMARITILYRPSAANVIPLPPFVGWEDTLRVGERHTIQHRFETSTPGWLFFSAEVTGGIPFINSPSGRRWGSFRFGNGIEDSTRVVGGEVSRKTESADKYREFDRLMPHPRSDGFIRSVHVIPSGRKLVWFWPPSADPNGTMWQVEWGFPPEAPGVSRHDTSQTLIMGVPRGTHVVFQLVTPPSRNLSKVAVTIARGGRTLVYRAHPMRIEYVASPDSGIADTVILRDQVDSTVLLVPIRTTADSTARILDEPRPGSQVR